MFVLDHLALVLVCSIQCSMENRTPAVQIAYEKCEGERCRRMLRELQNWIKSCEEANAAMSDFNKYVFREFSEELER